ncbi:hypothetical protein BV22DRAFT_1131601 [Leucogyrophana mollusca]|uniref:Uncharacterized protein n=1 Tax=Leucogyrophana mollusca TaxID=85980 RepID=A0ACB8BBS1_9AGAM|nr:hypothetical protein BV22DRAFT_1131601 [Leucogyrophana mollusca]
MVSSNRSMLGLSYIQINSTTPASDALAPETPSQRNATIIGSTLICSVLGSTVIAVRRWLKRTRRRKAKHRALYAIRPFMDIPLPPARPTGPFSLTTPPSPRSADQVMIIDSGGPRAGHGSPSAGDSSAQLRLAPSLTYPPVATRYTPVQTASTPDFPCEATVRPSRIAPLRRRNGAIGGRSQAPVIELPPPYDHAFIRL